MDSKHILKRLKEKKEISIDIRDLRQVTCFNTMKEVSSIESLCLTIHGHGSIKKYEFDDSIFESWCDENNIQFVNDELNRLMHLRIVELYANSLPIVLKKENGDIICGFSDEV